MSKCTVHAPTALHGFVAVRHLVLLEACAQLGGCKGVRIVGQLRTALRRYALLSRSTLRLAQDVHDLLHIVNVHDFERDEAAFFATLNPADPRVEQICILADRFADALRKSRLQTARQLTDRAA